jgi:hypothetical protein
MNRKPLKEHEHPRTTSTANPSQSTSMEAALGSMEWMRAEIAKDMVSLGMRKNLAENLVAQNCFALAWPISPGRIMAGADSEYDSDVDLPPLVVSDCSDDEEPADGDFVPLEPRGGHSKKAALEPCFLQALLGTSELIKRLKVALHPCPAALCLAGLFAPALTGLCCSRAGRDRDTGGVRRRR